MDTYSSLMELSDPRLARGYGGRFYGVYPAIVTDIVDPEGQGRVKVRLPWSPDSNGSVYEVWARLATLMAGANRGSWVVPDVEDEVLVSFEAGDTRRPYIIGSLWNGQDAPPDSMDGAGNNYRKVLRSRNGVKVTLDDSDGQEQTHDVITQIAGEHGLSTDIDIDGPTYRVLTQVNQSDLAFLRECARAVDAELWIDGSALFAQARSRRQTEELSLSYGHRLKEFAVTADLARQRTSLKVSGWNVEAKETIEYESDQTAIQSEMNGGQSGSALLEQTIGQRMDMLVHHVPLSNAEAQSLANAHYRSMARQFLTGQALAEGDGRLRAGSHVHIDGLGSLFDGRYYVNEVTHTFDSRDGYRTFFRVERPDLGSS